LLKKFEPDIAELTLIPSDGGRFEVSVDGKLIYSKIESHRHPQPGEVAGLIEKLLRGKS